MNDTYNKITNNIYIGNMWSPNEIIIDGKSNKIKPITHIISFIKLPKHIKENIEYNNIVYFEYSFDDSVDENIIQHYNLISTDIKKFLFDDNGTMLFLCQAGKSRSVSITILTLINLYNMNFDDAYNLISSKRETQINYRFKNDLKNYNKNN